MKKNGENERYFKKIARIYREVYTMAFIKIQKLVRDNSGKIISGSATIVDTEYEKAGTKSHCKHIVREKL